MTRPRYRVDVTIRRYEQPAYTYTFAAETTRPERTVVAAAYDAGENMTRGWRTPADVFHTGRRATVRLPGGGVRAYARAVPLTP